MNEIQVEPKIRFLVLYRDAQFSVERIHSIMRGSLRTLQSWKKKLDAGENILNIREGRGRKKKFRELLKKVKRSTTTNPQRASIRATGAKFNISRTSTNRIFHELGFSHRRVKVKHTLTKAEKQDRLRLCHELLNNHEEITDSFWADETGVWLSDMTKKKMWTLEKNPTVPEPVEDIKVNVWAAISLRGATSLYIYDENFEGAIYLRIIQERVSEMDRLYPDGWYYFHDAHPVHKANVVNEWAADHNITLTLLPNKISDINPIENLWSWLKDRVKKDSPTDRASLIRSLKKNWKDVNVQFLAPYINSLYTRCRDCIQRKGDYVDY